MIFFTSVGLWVTFVYMSEENKPQQLVRGLTWTHTLALVMGSMIGTGVFLKAGIMSVQAQSPLLVILAWVAAGALSLLGAFAYKELGKKIPKTGGEYVYLRTAYGDAPAFFYGWMRLAIGSAGSIAAYAVGMTIFLNDAIRHVVPHFNDAWVKHTFFMFGRSFEWSFGPAQVFAVSIIWLFSLINCLGVAFGGRLQTALTTIKIVGIVLIIGGVFFFASGGSWSHFNETASPQALAGCKPVTGISKWLPLMFGSAMISALWAYDGWNLMPMASGEVRDAKRNIPKALFLGVLGVTLLYVIINLAYFYALPFDSVISARSTFCKGVDAVATRAVGSFLGGYPTILPWVSLLFVLSSIGALNGSILTSARVPFAMAKDGLFFKRLAQLSQKKHVPIWSILVQAIWASCIAVSGSYDQITDGVLFASWIFYAMNAGAVLILRRKMPETDDSKNPILPILFVLVSVALTVVSLVQNFESSLIASVLILLGVPFYFAFKKRHQPSSTEPSNS